MWSRNATPVETCDAPPPSSTRRTRTSVSFVLRLTSAARASVCTSVLIIENDECGMMNGCWVLGSRCWGRQSRTQHLTPNTRFLFITHHSSLLLRKNLFERRQQFVVLLV